MSQQNYSFITSDNITQMQRLRPVREGNVAFWKPLMSRRLQECIFYFDKITEMQRHRTVREGGKMLLLTQLRHCGSHCRAECYKHEYTILITLQQYQILEQSGRKKNDSKNTIVTFYKSLPSRKIQTYIL